MNQATKMFYFAQRHSCISKILSIVMRFLFSCDLPIFGGGGIGENVSFEHNALGIVISREAVIGNGCKIYQNVTIGAGNGGYPELGKNVTVYPNCVIVGHIHIGDNAIIGACSFVNVDVPSNAVVGGVPARIIKDNHVLRDGDNS